jgi:hypothetical protein
LAGLGVGEVSALTAQALAQVALDDVLEARVERNPRARPARP